MLQIQRLMSIVLLLCFFRFQQIIYHLQYCQSFLDFLFFIGLYFTSFQSTMSKGSNVPQTSWARIYNYLPFFFLFLLIV